MSKHNGIAWATKALALPIDVIVAEYRQAKNPEKMIDILADRCDVNPCRIAWILNRCGMTVPVKKMPRALRSENSFDYVAHWEAVKMRQSVTGWRNRCGRRRVCPDLMNRI